MSLRKFTAWPDGRVVSPHGLLVVLLVALVGCGASPGSEVDPLTMEQRLWADGHGPITVGVPRVIAPAVIVEGDEVVGGWAWELTQLAALKVGVDLEPQVYDSVADAVAGLAAGEVDLVTGLSTRPDLEAFAVPISPLSWTPVVLAVGPARTAVTSLDDLAGGTVTTIPGSPIEARLEQELSTLEYVRADGLADALVRVYDGQVDAWAGPLAITSFQLAARGRNEPLRVIGDPLSIVEVGAWGAPGPALDVIHAGRERITDTELAVIHVRWTGFDLTDPAAVALPRWVLPAMWILLGLAVMLGLFTLLLRRQVATRTAQVQAANVSLSEMNAGLEQTVAERTKGLADANTQLLRSNDALARFANRAAHDLRGPLAAMLGFARLAADPRLDEERRRESLDTIATSTRRMSDLVDEMLQDAEELVPKTNTKVLADDLEEWLREFISLEAERHDATLLFGSDREVVDLPVTDLKQLLLNLVGNAMKHAGGAGVAVEVSLSRFDGPPARWTVTVDDDGQGIPEDQREMVLERGYRTSSAGALGSGLGLAACKDTIQALGGRLTVTASPRGGARLSFTLPATTPRAAEPGQAEVEQSEASGKS